jgi:hypothetical protein
VLPGVDDPDVWHAEVQIVVKRRLRTGLSVVRRHYLNTEIGRRCENVFLWDWYFGDDNIRDANSWRSYSNPKFGQRLKTESVPTLGKPYRGLGLCIAMPCLSHVPFHYQAIDELAVGVEAGAQIFLTGIKVSTAMIFRIAFWRRRGRQENCPIQDDPELFSGSS